MQKIFVRSLGFQTLDFCGEYKDLKSLFDLVAILSIKSENRFEMEIFLSFASKSKF